MSKPARYLVDPFETTLEDLIEEQASYFRQFLGRADALINGCADVVRKDDHELTGTKFPVGLIVEALKECEYRRGMRELSALRLELQEHLMRSYADSGFNYFNESYLPEDLDTASTLMRILGEEDSKLRADYDDKIRRNDFGEGIVATWLDTPDHERWFAGAKPFHLDVLLNHWLTELEWNRPVKKTVLLEAVQTYGLRNYWYLPALYTPYLYCRLIRRMAIDGESKFFSPLIEVVETWKKDPVIYQRSSNLCRFPKMDQLLATQPVWTKLDFALLSAISKCVGNRMVTTPNPRSPNLSTDWKAPLYWSLGFKAFASESVNRAVALLALVEPT